MKNTILSLAILIGAVALPSIALADTFFQANDGSVQPCDMASSTAEKQSCNSAIGNVNTSLLMEPWGITNGESQKLVVAAGTSIKDEGGVDGGICPYFYVLGCFNLVSLDYWKNQARYIAQHGDGRFGYWLNH